MQFNYEALDSQGREVKDVIEATSSRDAISKIRDKGMFPTKVKEAGKKTKDTTTKTFKEILSQLISSLRYEKKYLWDVKKYPHQVHLRAETKEELIEKLLVMFEDDLQEKK